MATTTTAAVMAAIRSIVNGLTPSAASAHKYLRAPTDKPWRSWLRGTSGSGCLRHYRLIRTGAQRDRKTQRPDQILVEQDLLLEVAYPEQPSVASLADLDALRDVIDGDATQIREALLQPANLTIDGHQATFTEILDVGEAPGVIIARIKATILFYRAQTLT